MAQAQARATHRNHMLNTTDDIALKGNPIDDVFGGMLRYSALVVAAKLGLVRALEAGPLDAAALAAALGTTEQGTRAVADVLVTAEYLELDGSRYARGPLARRWLGPDGPRDFTPALLWGYELWNLLWELPQSIRDGAPAQSLWERWSERPEAGKDFSDYMKVKSTLTVEAIVDAAPVPTGAQRLLDLGGSHGLHSIAFCARYPELTATVMDLPEALTGTAQSAADAGVGDRISTKPGSFFTDDLGEGYDVVLLFEILHCLPAEDNAELIMRAARALRPGGVIVILEDVAGEQLDEHNAAFSLCMFACTGDRTYTLEEIDGWLTDAGLVDVRQLQLPASVSLVVGSHAGGNT
jgi:SAM-dependent methyltransferase